MILFPPRVPDEISRGASHKTLSWFIVLGYLKDNCGANRVFSRSLVLGYSYKRYSTLLRNWDCPLTLRTADPTRGIQVRFRYLDTTQSDDCSQARLTVSDTHGPLTCKEACFYV